MFLWGLISLVVVPWEPFWVSNLAQTVVCPAVLVYFVRTWRRPRRRVAEAVSAILIVYSLLILPWMAVVWCQLGRPLEAFVIPQVAVVSLAHVFPGRWSLGVAAMCLFAAESFFALAYAHYLGLGPLIPLSEPFATAAFTVLGFGLLLLRRRRRDLTRRHVRVQAEIQALDRVRPLFAHAREELQSQVSVLATEVGASGADRATTSSRSCDRALGRLGDLRRQLGGLVGNGEAAPSQHEAEQRLQDHDAQLGATMLAGLGAALSLLGCGVESTGRRRSDSPIVFGDGLLL